MQYSTLSRLGKCTCWALTIIILASCGVIGRKWNAMVFQQGAMEWEHRVSIFCGEPLKLSEVAKYQDHFKHLTPDERKSLKGRITLVAPFDGSPVRLARETDKMPANNMNATLLPNAPTVGSVGWSFTLTIQALDVLLMTTPSTRCSANAAGASIGVIGTVIGPDHDGVPLPDGWPAGAATAWAAWTSSFPYPSYGGSSFLLAASVGSTTEYKVVGYKYASDLVTRTWVGDNQWSMSGTYTVQNLQCRLATTILSNEKYTAPRRWTQRSAVYALFPSTDPSKPTTTTTTLGDMTSTVSCVFSLNPDGSVVSNSGPLALTYGVAVDAPPAAGVSCAEVQGISCSAGGQKVNLSANFWNTSNTCAANWTANPSMPTGAVWNAYNAGNTLKLVWTGYGAQSSGSIAVQTHMYGPVRFNVMAGRFGRSTPNFPISPQFDVGLQYCVSDGPPIVMQNIYLSPGLSPWYTSSTTHLATDGRVGLGAGQYSWGGGSWVVAPVVTDDWLNANGELLVYQAMEEDDDGHMIPSAPPLDNRAAYIQLASVAYDPATAGPWWGPAVNYTRTDISVDIPPGQTTRPTNWAAGANATIDPAHNERWTVTGENGQVTRTLASRFDARMDYLANVWGPGMPAYDVDWPIIAKANHGLDADPPTVAAACAVEDVTNYDNSRILAFSFNFAEGERPDGLDWSKATLDLTYANWSFEDYCWNQDYGGVNRFGSDGWFTADSSDANYLFNGYGDNDGDTLYFDLAQLQRSNTVSLRHVRSVLLTLPGGGTYRLADAQLIADPDHYGMA